MLKQKYNTPFQNVSELMIRINNSHHTLQTVHSFYTEDIWEYFKSLGCDKTSDVTDCFAQFIDAIQEDTLYTLKIIFDWIVYMEKQLEVLACEWCLPERVVPGEKYIIIAPDGEQVEFVLCSDWDAKCRGDEANISRIETIASKWEAIAAYHGRIIETLERRLEGLAER